ncbi:enoyl-CoA hydratase-related protein [Cupriavidus sp. IDO]|uniref:enoyl-CoA hydratase-related protein n=1 Tax=Cupriavidus sp. IDO TaxID=1539142 RepID=UPI0005799CF2|nr:enoyl-CoA hydratase-related protein [Cupriavidus sp. IDO]KWR77787.1 enoyl-CoA hydratase [Cupriavidus sp. IDO]
MSVQVGDDQFEGIEASLKGTVWHIVLRRPHKRNALTMEMFTALAESLGLADAHPGVRAIAVTGEGSGFSAGHDLTAFDEWPQLPNDPVPVFLHRLAKVLKPLVVGVHGFAAGVGATMLLHADWVIATPDARLRLPFVDLGIAPEAGSSLLLARSVGSLRAKQMLLGGEIFTSEAAERWGLVTELSTAEDLSERTLERARALGAKDFGTYQRIKSWLTCAEDVHERIEAEIVEINRAIVELRMQGKGVKS